MINKLYIITVDFKFSYFITYKSSQIYVGFIHFTTTALKEVIIYTDHKVTTLASVNFSVKDIIPPYLKFSFPDSPATFSIHDIGLSGALKGVQIKIALRKNKV